MIRVASIFDGIEIIVVEPGTVIKNEKTGEEYTVTGDNFVTDHGVIYCTKAYFDKLKASVPEMKYG